jgi:RNA polymerase sigma factor FliA
MDPTQEALVLQYRDLAASIAAGIYRSATHVLDLDELRSVAYLGLVGAADRWPSYCSENGFDPERVEYFRPFVLRRVRGAVMDHLRATDWASRSLRSQSRVLQDAGLDLGPEAGGTSYQVLAQRTGMTVEAVRVAASQLARRPTPLDLGDEVDVPTRESVEGEVSSAFLLQVVRKTISGLPAPVQAVLVGHYYEGRELKAVAKELGIRESRASMLHIQGVLAVRTALASIVSQELL